MVQINTVIPEKEHIKSVRTGIGRLKTTEPTVRGRTQDVAGASQACTLSVGQSRREKLLVQASKSGQSPRSINPVWVPVISSTGNPLMPCRPAYARALIKSGRAKRRWFKGIFAIKMLDRAEGEIQQVVCGIDPGSKREAFTVQSKQHTYLNVLSDAVTWVSDRVKERRMMRKHRRRKAPCRVCRFNRKKHNIFPPSTKSRWQIKFNIIKFLRKLYPIKDYVVEDTKARTIKRISAQSDLWNKNFSPLARGKTWFYIQVLKFGDLMLKVGFDTYVKRSQLKLDKAKNKVAETFNAHCVDSWVGASFITGKSTVDNASVFRIIPLQLHKRKLHFLNPGLKGIRSPYGGTISMGFKRGSVVKHRKRGLVYVGGSLKGKRISLHDIKTGVRVSQRGLCKDVRFLFYNSWITRFVKED